MAIAKDDGRPECMAVLGLLPPYTVEDVKASYRDRSFRLHPDRGGDPMDFHRLKEAYEQALQYMEVRGNLREWIANRVESHMLQEEVVNEVTQRGGHVNYERMDWLQKTLGEGFAYLEERLRGIQLHGDKGGDDFLNYLFEKKANIPFLLDLDLSGSPLTDKELEKLAVFQTLKNVNISRTAVTGAGIRKMLNIATHLRTVNATGLKVSWISRIMIERSFPDVKFIWK